MAWARYSLFKCLDPLGKEAGTTFTLRKGKNNSSHGYGVILPLIHCPDRVESTPRGFKYPVFEASGSNGIWDQSPSILGTWTSGTNFFQRAQDFLDLADAPHGCTAAQCGGPTSVVAPAELWAGDRIWKLAQR